MYRDTFPPVPHFLFGCNKIINHHKQKPQEQVDRLPPPRTLIKDFTISHTCFGRSNLQPIGQLKHTRHSDGAPEPDGSLKTIIIVPLTVIVSVTLTYFVSLIYYRSVIVSSTSKSVEDDT
jgi:hypothetical protein